MIGLAAGLVVAGVRIVSRGGETVESDNPTQVASPSETVEPTPEPDSPQAIALEFASLWEQGDITGLHDLFSPATKGKYPLGNVKAAYENLNARGSVVKSEVELQEFDETSAQFHVRLQTEFFELLEWDVSIAFDSSSGRPQIVWTPASLHPALETGYVFENTLTFPRRGQIFDRDGEGLAVNQEVRFIGLNRSLVLNRATVTDELLDFGFTLDAINAAFDSPLGLSQRVPIGTAGADRVDDVADLVNSTPGTMVWVEPQRVHPLGPAAAHVVGYTRDYTAEELEARVGFGLEPGDRTGAAGIEAAMDFRLAGQVGAELRITNGFTEVIEVVFSREFIDGEDVQTTLDADVLRKAYELLEGKAGAAVVIEPSTNEILALNSSPTYDPDAFEHGDSAAIAAILETPDFPLTNRATIGLYSAGSTFKLVTGAAGLAFGDYTPADRIYCGSIWTGVDPPRANWEGAQGNLTIAEGLKRSCNPVFYEIAFQLYNIDEYALSNMARAFGYGAPSGVVGLFEEGGLVPDPEWKSRERGEIWYPGDSVNLGIGQGDLLITPLQLANAYSTIVAEDLRAPVIIQGEIATSSGPPQLTAEQADFLRSGLEMVTGPGGTAAWAYANRGYNDFAGKSGTAEDSNDQQHVLFVAYSPRENPVAVAAVVLDEGFSGSIEVGPLARDLVLEVMAQ